MVNIGAGAATTAMVNVDYEFSLKNVALLKPNQKLSIGSYLNYSLARIKGSIIANLSSGGAQPFLSLTQIGQIVIPCPRKKAEQEAIAGALGDADAFIEAMEQILAKKHDLKQGAMQELLFQKQSWRPSKLGGLGVFFKGSGVKKDETLSGELACIRYGEIYTKHNDCVRAFHSWISPSVAATAKRLKAGDVLFAGSGETKEEIGKCVAFLDDIEAYAGGDIVILRPHSANSMFLGYYLNTAPIVQQKASKGQGDAVVHISAAALADIVVKLPSQAEQIVIAQTLSDMDAEIAALEQKLAKARAVKQGMTQKLLTGQVRLI